MEKIFINASALYELVGTEENESPIAVETWETMLENNNVLVTNNYVIIECFSLVQHRLGIEFARYLQSNIMPFLQVDWVDE